MFSQLAAHILPVGDPAMLITLNFFYGNVFYIVMRAKLSNFDLDDIEGRVIPFYKGFPG